MCGGLQRLLRVSETERCKYAAVVATPAVCEEARIVEISRSLGEEARPTAEYVRSSFHLRVEAGKAFQSVAKNVSETLKSGITRIVRGSSPPVPEPTRASSRADAKSVGEEVATESLRPGGGTRVVVWACLAAALLSCIAAGVLIAMMIGPWAPKSDSKIE